MSTAAAMAGVAGICAVLGGWELLVAVERGAFARRVARIAGPLVAAGRRGHLPTAPERRRLVLVAAATFGAAGWLLAGAALAVGLAAAAPVAVGRLLAARRRRWRAQVVAGAPDAARALADALGGGHSVRGAIAEVAPGLPGAAGDELRAVAARLELGVPTEATLERLRVRCGASAWDTIVAAILLQRDAGGDLATLLRTIARSQEAAVRAEADARTTTAQARFTARLVAVLPVAALALAELGAPGTVAGMLGDPLPRVLVILAAGLQAMGFVAVGRAVR